MWPTFTYFWSMINQVVYTFVSKWLLPVAGIARGCGWQRIGAFINLGAYYFVGLPLSVVLCFVLHLRGKGLWIGLLVGTTVQVAMFALITAFTNWQKQVLLLKFSSPLLVYASLILSAKRWTMRNWSVCCCLCESCRQTWRRIEYSGDNSSR